MTPTTRPLAERAAFAINQNADTIAAITLGLVAFAAILWRLAL